MLGIVERFDSRWSFVGIEGSLPEGFSLKQASYRHSEIDKVSRMQNLDLAYERTQGDLAITNVSLGSAHLYFKEDALEKDDVVGEGGHTKKESIAEQTEEFASAVGASKLLIKKVDINDVTLESVETGEKIFIKKILSSGILVEDGKLKMGPLSINSSNLLVSVKPIEVDQDTGMGSSVLVEGKIGQKLHKSIKQDIKFSGVVDLDNLGFTRLDGFDHKIKIEKVGNGKASRVKISGLTIPDYIGKQHLPPLLTHLQNINLELLYNHKHKKQPLLKVEAGNFMIGNHQFVIELPQTTHKKIVARANSGDMTFIMTITEDDLISFTSIPKRDKQEVIAQLFWGQGYLELSKDEKEKAQQILHNSTTSWKWNKKYSKQFYD